MRDWTRNGKPVARKAPASPSRGDAPTRRPFRKAPEPFSATKRSPFTGSQTTPRTSSPSRPPAVRPIETAQCGKPRTKFAVPSRGSTIQAGAPPFEPVAPPSSPTKRSPGKAPRRSSFTRASLSRSARETTSFRPFSSTSDGSRDPKCPRRRSPARRAASTAASSGRETGISAAG